MKIQIKRSIASISIGCLLVFGSTGFANSVERTVATVIKSKTVTFFCLPAKPKVQHAMVRSSCLPGETKILFPVTAGPRGATGLMGPQGATGAAGTNGTNGAAGATGAAGTNGTNGAAGATGAAGTNGTNEIGRAHV